MKKYTKYLFTLMLFSFIFMSSKTSAHAVQVGYCTNCNGDLRIWIEHWHGSAWGPSSLTVTITVNGVPTTITGATTLASGLDVPAANLPGCFTSLVPFASCPASANTYNEWVAYDFPAVQCGVPITVSVAANAGTTVYTQDCGGMYPATTPVFTIPCALNQLPDVDTCAGNNVGPFIFPAGNTWTNTNPAIGLPANGAGDVPMFTAANNATTQTGTITINNTCGVSTFDITVYPAPTSDFIANVGCPGQPVGFVDQSTSLGGAITGWVWDFGDGSPVFNGQNPPPYVYPPGGPFNVTLTTTTANGCTHDTIIPVDPLAGLIANFIAPSVCDGNASILTDSSIPIGNILNWAWDWDNDGVVDDVNQNSSFIFPGPGSYNVELLVVGAGGCSDSIVIPIIVNPLPTANFTGTSVCIGTANSFTDMSNIVTGTITSWQWDFGDLTTITDTSILQNPTYTYADTGTYNVTLTIISDSGCTDVFSTTVTVYASPVANFTSNLACAGANTVFTDITTPLGTIVNWGWDFDGDLIVDDVNQNPSFTFPGVGAYPVNLSVIDPSGCTHDTAIVVNVSAQPIAAFTFTNECYGTATGFTDLSNPNGGVITNWDWDFDNNGTIDNSIQNPTNGYPASGSYVAELLVTTANGCVDSITLAVVVNPIPVAEFTVGNVCFGSTSMFNDISSITTGNIIGWQWDFGDGVGTSLLQNPTYNYTAGGTYGVTLTVTSDSGCINTYVDSAYVYFLPAAAFAVNNECLNVAASFNDLSNGNGGTITSWSWDFDGNGTIDDNTQNPSNLYLTDGVYNVQLIVSTGSGCADTIIQPITIYPMPTANFAFVNACMGAAVAFTDMSNVTSGNLTNWDWDFGNLNSSMLQNPAENYASEGIYGVQLIVTSDNGCMDTLSQNIEVWPNPVVNFSPTEVCLNFPSQFNDLTTVSNLFTPNNIVQWTWDFGDGIGTSNNQNPIYAYTASGTYQANLSAVSNNGCVSNITLDVTVNPLPQVSFDGIPLAGCTPVIVDFTDLTAINAPGLLSSWQWDFGNGMSSGAQNPTGISFDNTSAITIATYGVSLTVISDKGCIGKDSIANMISSYPIPVAAFSFSPDPTDVYDKEITFTDNSIIASVWDWNFGDGSTSITQHPIYEYPDSGSFDVVLYIENIYGCRDTARRTVIIDPAYAIWIPNTFTPDGDGINDFFFVQGFGLEEIEMKVFDRWGTLIFEGYSINSQWSGNYKGSMAQEDVYVYKIRVKDVFNEWHDFLGKITLIK